MAVNGEDQRTRSPEGGKPLVLLKKEGGLGIITLNRPEKRNAMSVEAQAQLRAALSESAADCKVLIITGNGAAFCSGVDLTERSTGQRVFANGGNSWLETNEAVKEHPAICIAAVNGYALGGGLTLVHNCELAIASERAEFGMPEMGFAAFPGLAGPATIRRVLPKHAAYMILTSRRIDAATAERWGIVNSVVPHEQLLSEARSLAQWILQFDETALDYSKKAIRDLELMGWSAALEYGGYVGSMIRSQSGAGEDRLAAFARGERNPGQGAKVPRMS